ncbi:aromatic ring-hydroxylating dioxygenase subunit alpha [Parasphingorhabdus sp.]|uniref:aromatic ring-hydroxylating oxygenase subunit alpha n=1 Tax=Parasphingorhabdus sp. TaxID=2709688 RepID=UPI0032F018CB
MDDLKFSNSIQEGFATTNSPLARDLLSQDTRPLPHALSAVGNHRPEMRPIPFSTYYDPEYAALELEYVWKKCWQFACREEDIQSIGDRYVYDVGPLSFIIVKTSNNSFKAFYNSCLHRGTRLCNHEGGGNQIRCPFHGWSWNVDGSICNIPGQWDFPNVDAEYRLPEAKIECWGGCIFINPDLNSAPLVDALGILPAHFAHFDLAERFTLVRTAKKVRANWKTVWAAFLEAYHVAETHFDATGFNGDANTQYDCFDNGKSVISRLITPSAVPSPTLGDTVSARDAAIEAVMSFAEAFGPDASATIPDFENTHEFGRSDVAAWRRQIMQKMLGADCGDLSDSEMIDSIQYAMFPNFGPWLGEGLPLMYQFLPYGNNPDESLFVVRLMAPLSPGSPRPPAATMLTLDFDEPFSSLPQWGRAAHIFDQDMSNLPIIQQGMKHASPQIANLTLGRYQEQRIQLMHNFVDQMIERECNKTE